MLTKLKLSELDNNLEVASVNASGVYTVEELKDEIMGGEPHHETKGWYIVGRKKWKPNAHNMLENYIEGESDEMYEDWEERVLSNLTDEAVAKIQAVLDEVLDHDYVTEYYTYETPIEIDIFPK